MKKRLKRKPLEEAVMTRHSVVKGLFFGCMLFSSINLHAAGRKAQELVKAGSWVYDAFASLSIESGLVDFTDQAPLSVQELKLYLSEINYDQLSVAGKVQYKKLAAYFDDGRFSVGSDIVSASVEPEVNVEGYYKSEDDIDWVYDRYERRPILYAPVTFSVADYLSMGMDLYLGQNKGRMQHDDNYTNVPYSPGHIDVNFPDTGYFSAGYMFTDLTGVNFQLGMGSQSVGRSMTGSMIMSEYFTGASYANFEIFNPNIRYNMNVTQYNVDKYMYTHRFDVRFFKKLSVSVQESMLVYHPLELRFLNPLTIYHGMSPWRDYGSEESNTCAYLAIKASYAVSNYIRIYGLYAQDQYQTAYERYNWPDNTTPNAIGGQLGVEAYVPMGAGYVHGRFEGSYAQPYLYIKEDPNWSLVRTYSESIGDDDPFYEWVGSPLGPDTISAELNLGYEVPGSWAVTGSYLFMAKGEMSGTNVFNSGLNWGGTDTTANFDYWAFPDSDRQGQKEAKRRQRLTTPSGTAEYVNRVAVRGSISPLDYLSFVVQPAYVFIFNHNHEKNEFTQGIEFALAVNLKLSRMFSHKN